MILRSYNVSNVSIMNEFDKINIFFCLTCVHKCVIFDKKENEEMLNEKIRDFITNDYINYFLFGL